MNKRRNIKKNDIVRNNLSREEYAKEISPFSITAHDLNRADYFNDEVSEELIEVGKETAKKRPKLKRKKLTNRSVFINIIISWYLNIFCY